MTETTTEEKPVPTLDVDRLQEIRAGGFRMVKTHIDIEIGRAHV